MISSEGNSSQIPRVSRYGLAEPNETILRF